MIPGGAPEPPLSGSREQGSGRGQRGLHWRQGAESPGSMAGLGFRGRSAAAERGEKAIERGEKAMTRAMRTTLAILVALVLLAAFGTFYVLEEGEQAVILQFGRPVGVPATEAGRPFEVPFI